MIHPRLFFSCVFRRTPNGIKFANVVITIRLMSDVIVVEGSSHAGFLLNHTSLFATKGLERSWCDSQEPFSQRV